MSDHEQINCHSRLQRLIVCYLLLGITDTIHHLHAAVALGHKSALHAVAINVVLIPLAIIGVYLFAKNERKIFLRVFLSIALLAILIPGIYHGGWDHLVKNLAFLRVNGESTQINLLFPPDNFHYWFYELTGTLEFLLALVCAFYMYRYVTTTATHA